MKPSISPAATDSPDPQTRSIKDGRPKPAVYGSPSYGARWDPEATPLRADRGSQPSASGARVRDSLIRVGNCAIARAHPRSPSQPRRPPLSMVIWVQRRTGGPEGYPPLSWPQGISAAAVFPRGHAATLRSLRRGSRGRGPAAPSWAGRTPGSPPGLILRASQGFPSRRV